MQARLFYLLSHFSTPVSLMRWTGEVNESLMSLTERVFPLFLPRYAVA